MPELVSLKVKKTTLSRILLRIVLVGLILAFLLAVAVLLTDWRVSKAGRALETTLDQLDGEAAFDCVIVPGALVYANGWPSAMLQDRLDMAVRIYNQGLTGRILVSGDHGQTDYDEVNVMRQYLIDAGIPAAHIFMDHAGFDTFDTMYRAQAVFGVKRALVTTQDFHLYRALYIGQQLGLDVQGVASAYRDSYRSSWYNFREYLARFKAFLDCEILHAKPKYTGPTIPISGDGNMTAG